MSGEKGGKGEGQFGSTRADDEAQMDFIVGTTPEGRVLMDFRGMTINHLKLEQDMALNLAEALVQAVQQAKQGIIITTPGHG